MSPGWVLLRDVEHEGQLVDVTVEGGIVRSIGPAGRTGDRARAGEVVDGRGGAVLPGLHDHHLHLVALAASWRSTAVGDAGPGRDALASRLREAARSLPPGAWLRATGYHEGSAGPLDRWVLDAVVGERPVRVQHRSGAMWVLSSRGLAEVGLLEGAVPDGCEQAPDGTPTGRLFGLDAWLRDRIRADPPDLAAVGEALLRRGVTGVTDATPYPTIDAMRPIVDAVGDGRLPQHVVVTGSPDLDPSQVPAPLTAGPAKLLLPDHDLPPPDAVADGVRRARRHHRAVAVHCVTLEALVVALAALDEVGSVPGDRIEHGAVVPPELHGRLHRLGLTVVTQPNLVAERGDDYLAEVDPRDVPNLWPARSLAEAGIGLAGGTDAPFGGLDPWRLVAAAVDRRTRSGAVVGSAERLPAVDALSLLLRPADAAGAPPRRVTVGAPADLCVLGEPAATALADPADVEVTATLVGGQVRFVAG